MAYYSGSILFVNENFSLRQSSPARPQLTTAAPSNHPGVPILQVRAAPRAALVRPLTFSSRGKKVSWASSASFSSFSARSSYVSVQSGPVFIGSEYQSVYMESG